MLASFAGLAADVTDGGREPSSTPASIADTTSRGGTDAVDSTYLFGLVWEAERRRGRHH